MSQVRDGLALLYTFFCRRLRKPPAVLKWVLHRDFLTPQRMLLFGDHQRDGAPPLRLYCELDFLQGVREVLDEAERFARGDLSLWGKSAFDNHILSC